MAHIRNLVHESNVPLPSVATLLAGAPSPNLSNVSPSPCLPMPPLSAPFASERSVPHRPPPLLYSNVAQTYPHQHHPSPQDPSALLLRAIDTMESNNKNDVPTSPSRCRFLPITFNPASPHNCNLPVSPTAVLPGDAHASSYASPHASATDADATCTEGESARVRVRKGPWRPAETALLQRLVAERGPCNWAAIASNIPGRNGKQARERWKNHLDPRLKKTRWSALEDAILYDNYCRLGNKWSAIARRLPGRSDNDVKNRFNGAIRPRIAAGNPPTYPPDALAMRAATSHSMPPHPAPPASAAPGQPPDMFSIYE